MAAPIPGFGTKAGRTGRGAAIERLTGTTWTLSRQGCTRDEPLPLGGQVAWFDDTEGLTVLGQAPAAHQSLAGRRWTLRGDAWGPSSVDLKGATHLGPASAWSPSLKVLLTASGADSRWSLFDGAWRLLDTSPAPAPRVQAGMALDSARGRFLLQGGQLVGATKLLGAAVGGPTDELWALTPQAGPTP